MNTRLRRPGRRSCLPTRALLALAAASALATAGTGCSTPEQPHGPAGTEVSTSAPVTVVDDAGRSVTFDHPVRSAVVANRYNSELIRAMGSIDKVVGVDTNTAQDRPYWPMFDPGNVIGKGQSELNVEKIIQLKPEVLVLPRNGRGQEYAPALEAAGIKVLTVTGWDNKDLPKQMSILGAAFGNAAGAQRVTDFYQQVRTQVTDRVGAQQPKKTVYWEYGDPYTTAIPGTSNDGWHNMIVTAGGTNIFGDPGLKGDTVDPEQVLRADPDLVLKVTSGGALKNTGVYTPPAAGEFERVGREMQQRPGWSGLKAVRGGDVHLMTGFAGGGLGKMVGTVYTAKWLYPEAMKDVDPDAVFTRWLGMQGMAPVSGHTYDVPAAG